MHRALDEVALTEDIPVHAHALRQACRDGLQLRLDLAGQRDGIGPGLLLQGEDDAGSAVDAGIAAFVQGRALAHLGDLAEEDARSVGERLDHGGGQVIRRFHPREVTDEHFGVRVGQEAAGGIDVRLVDRGLHVVQSHPGGDQPDRIDQHLVLPHVAAHHRDLRDAGNAHQPTPQIPIGQGPQLGRTDRLVPGGQTDGHDLAHDRGNRTKERPHVRRQRRRHLGHLFPHDLPRAVDVRLPTEFDKDQRQSDAGHRPHALHAGGAIDRRLDRHGDEQFHLVRGQSRHFGENGHGRTVQVGKDIDRNSREHPSAIRREHGRHGNHQQAVAHGEGDEAVEHGVSARGRARRSCPQTRRRRCIAIGSGRWSPRCRRAERLRRFPRGRPRPTR